MVEISQDELTEAIEDGTIGFCAICGSEQYGLEPDAEMYPCTDCGNESSVYGVEHVTFKHDLFKIIP